MSQPAKLSAALDREVHLHELEVLVDQGNGTFLSV